MFNRFFHNPRCRKCGHIPCGCSDVPITTVPPTDCNPPPNCSEYIFSNCEIYTGPNIISVCDAQGAVLAVGQPVCTSGGLPGNQSFFGVSGTSSGQGSGATFIVNIGSPDQSPCQEAFDITVVNGGSGYHIGDTITILGASIGGATPDDNLILTITSVTSDIDSCRPGPYILNGMGMNEAIQRLTLFASGISDLNDTSCQRITTLAIVSVTATSITISFDASSAAAFGYYILVSKADLNFFSIVHTVPVPATSSTVSYTITTYDGANPLVTKSSYDIYVIANCPPLKSSVTIRATTL